MITVAILLWLFYRQSIVAGEWVLGTFEAKCIAYALLLFSLNGFMHQQVVLPSILLGLAFSLHPLIGLWGALAVGLSLLILRSPIDRIIKSGCYTALFALPGLIPLLMRPLEDGTASSEAMKFVTLVVMPYHFDPFYFASSKRLLLLLGIILCFNWWHFRVQDKDHRHGLHLLILFQSFLGLFFVLGFFARHIENYELLVAMPWRLCSFILLSSPYERVAGVLRKQERQGIATGWTVGTRNVRQPGRGVCRTSQEALFHVDARRGGRTEGLQMDRRKHAGVIDHHFTSLEER
jgi:hypothetical protein